MDNISKAVLAYQTLCLMSHKYDDMDNPVFTNVLAQKVMLAILSRFLKYNFQYDIVIMKQNLCFSYNDQDIDRLSLHGNMRFAGQFKKYIPNKVVRTSLCMYGVNIGYIESSFYCNNDLFYRYSGVSETDAYIYTQALDAYFHNHTVSDILEDARNFIYGFVDIDSLEEDMEEESSLIYDDAETVAWDAYRCASLAENYNLDPSDSSFDNISDNDLLPITKALVTDVYLDIVGDKDFLMENLSTILRFISSSCSDENYSMNALYVLHFSHLKALRQYFENHPSDKLFPLFKACIKFFEGTYPYGKKSNYAGTWNKAGDKLLVISSRELISDEIHSNLRIDFKLSVILLDYIYQAVLV